MLAKNNDARFGLTYATAIKVSSHPNVLLINILAYILIAMNRVHIARKMIVTMMRLGPLVTGFV